jgi:hypothetical protein
MSTQPTPKPQYNPYTAPKVQLHVEATLDSDLDFYSSGRTRLPTTNNAVGFPIRDRADPKVILGHVFFSTNPTGAVVVSFDNNKRQWSIQINDIIKCAMEGDRKYLEALKNPPKPKRLAKGAKKLVKNKEAKRLSKIKKR